MDSRLFIKDTAILIDDIKAFKVAYLSPEDEQVQGSTLQKRMNALYQGLMNPTLPSAYKLRDAALDIGLFIDPIIQRRLASFENI